MMSITEPGSFPIIQPVRQHVGPPQVGIGNPEAGAGGANVSSPALSFSTTPRSSCHIAEASSSDLYHDGVTLRSVSAAAV